MNDSWVHDSERSQDHPVVGQHDGAGAAASLAAAQLGAAQPQGVPEVRQEGHLRAGGGVLHLDAWNNAVTHVLTFIINIEVKTERKRYRQVPLQPAPCTAPCTCLASLDWPRFWFAASEKSGKAKGNLRNIRWMQRKHNRRVALQPASWGLVWPRWIDLGSGSWPCRAFCCFIFLGLHELFNEVWWICVKHQNRSMKDDDIFP